MIREFISTEIAWAAGFWDGEGSVSISKGYYFNRKGKQLRSRIQANVSQTNNSFSIHRFKAAIQVGNVSGPTRNFNTTWVASTFEEVQATIAILWKFLCPVKKKQYKLIAQKWLEIYAKKIS